MTCQKTEKSETANTKFNFNTILFVSMKIKFENDVTPQLKKRIGHQW
jgi:hypothetical protein